MTLEHLVVKLIEALLNYLQGKTNATGNQIPRRRR